MSSVYMLGLYDGRFQDRIGFPTLWRKLSGDSSCREITSRCAFGTSWLRWQGGAFTGCSSRRSFLLARSTCRVLYRPLDGCSPRPHHSTTFRQSTSAARSNARRADPIHPVSEKPILDSAELRMLSLGWNRESGSARDRLSHSAPASVRICRVPFVNSIAHSRGFPLAR